MLTERDRDIIKWIENYKLITIEQCGYIFFNRSYEGARRRLLQLEKNYNKIKSYRLKETNEKVYYIQRKSSYHNVLVINYVKSIVKNGGSLIDLKLTPKYLEGKIIPDAFLIFEYDNKVYFTLLEVDLFHETSNSKMQTYEELYKSLELQDICCGKFPIIVIAKDSVRLRYNSSNFPVVYMDLQYRNISSLLLL